MITEKSQHSIPREDIPESFSEGEVTKPREAPREIREMQQAEKDIEQREIEAGEKIREIISEAPEDLQRELMEFVAEAEEEDTDPEKLLVEVLEKNGKAEANADIVFTKMEANLAVKPEEITDLTEDQASEILDKFVGELMEEPENVPAEKRQQIINIFERTQFSSAPEAFTEGAVEAEVPPEISKSDALVAINTLLTS